MVALTLLRQASPLSNPARQRELLEGHAVPPFEQTLQQHALAPLHSTGLQVLQINLGKLCNQTCQHCHVDAGPERREIMEFDTMEACLSVLRQHPFEVVDITGGAPEMNPHFRYLVHQARALGRHVIDRCNLTILMAPGYTDLAEFLAEHRVEIVASLPCYLESNCDRQRGDGVFQKSIEALRRLNTLGYGRPGSGLLLNLVFNPVGPSLPPPQESLEQAYRDQLKSRYDVDFNHLFTITNMPISRFLDDLLRTGDSDTYMERLLQAFNPAVVGGLMCRTMLSVDWQGNLYDCDFNQMLELSLQPGLPRTIHEFDALLLKQRRIVTGRHCYGCTAGAGSSCQGALLSE